MSELWLDSLGYRHPHGAAQDIPCALATRYGDTMHPTFARAVAISVTVAGLTAAPCARADEPETKWRGAVAAIPTGRPACAR